ncbi:Cytochrome P450 [Mycena venus]|uniref:Cytochrome P450 n=1 Tax=Mycena venus TaxID=2733690 RepID=A0A8H7CU01_9AGAR|nr:Cytochrome P450 [Mycena venus]
MFPTLLNTVAAGVGLYILRSLHLLYASSKRQRNFPPGPPTVPFIGNILDFPREQLQFKFTEWSKKYGAIYSLKVMHLTIIVLNSPTAVKEIIDKRGATSANRPASVIADIVTPNNLNLGSGQYANDTWKALRKASVHMLRPENMDLFKPFQRAEVIQLLWEMSTTPETFWEDIARMTTSFFMGVIYGIRAPRATSYAARAFTETNKEFIECMDVGKAPPVDVFPILNAVPARFSGWKQRALSLKKRQEELFGYLLDIVKARVIRGQNNGAFMEEAYTHAEKWGLSPPLLLNLGGALLQGSDTPAGIVQNFVLFLSAHPEAQKKAQMEIDAVVGMDQPPTWEDLPRLPYMHAFIEECMRFRPIAPLALPHAMSEDETYDGMLFPKDAIVFMNVWGIMHDEKYYEEPEKFIPERFLAHPLGVRPDVEDDPARRDLSFGGGRRVLANLIWAFNFSPAIKPSGEVVPPDLWAFSDGITFAPRPFKTTIAVRSPEKKDIIRRLFLEQTELFKPFEQDLQAQDTEYIQRVRETIRMSSQ